MLTKPYLTAPRRAISGGGFRDPILRGRTRDGVGKGSDPQGDEGSAPLGEWIRIHFFFGFRIRESFWTSKVLVFFLETHVRGEVTGGGSDFFSRLPLPFPDSDSGLVSPAVLHLLGLKKQPDSDNLRVG